MSKAQNIIVIGGLIGLGLMLRKRASAAPPINPYTIMSYNLAGDVLSEEVCDGQQDGIQFQNALDSIGGDRGTIRIGDGDYEFRREIHLPQYSNITVEGGPNTVISFYKSDMANWFHTGALIIPANNGAYTDIAGFTMRNLKFQGFSESVRGFMFAFMSAWEDNQNGQVCGPILFENIECVNCGLKILNVDNDKAIIRDCYGHDHDLPYNNSDSMFEIRHCKEALLEDNTVDVFYCMGVHAQQSLKAIIRDNTALNGHVMPGSEGVGANSVKDLTLHKNHVESQGNCTIIEKCYGELIVTENEFFGIPGLHNSNGMYLWTNGNAGSQKAAYCFVNKNKFDGHGNNIVIEDFIEMEFTENDVLNSTSRAITVDMSSGVIRKLLIGKNNILNWATTTPYQGGIDFSRLGDLDAESIEVVENILDGKNNPGARGIVGNGSVQSYLALRRNDISNCPGGDLSQIGSGTIIE